jgi:hypothetical protein
VKSFAYLLFLSAVFFMKRLYDLWLMFTMVFQYWYVLAFREAEAFLVLVLDW